MPQDRIVTKQLIILEDLKHWQSDSQAPCQLVHVDEYLTGPEYQNLYNIRIINLCRSYRYLSVGYYCSLLAEARRHKALPSVKSMLDLSRKSIYSLDAIGLEEHVHRGLQLHHGAGEHTEFRLDIYFGRCRYPGLQKLARRIFEKFSFPLLCVTFRYEGGWHIRSIKALPITKLDEEGRTLFYESLVHHLRRRCQPTKAGRPPRFDLAILHNPHDPLPPSNHRALKYFARAGRSLGIEVDLILSKDYGRLAEYDALFIRDTTNINHYTYRFAKRAESEGMVVIDDPASIRFCTNKVYLAELLRSNRIATPNTVILGKSDLDAAEQVIGYPMVLKVPDSSFSRGVYKADSADQMRGICRELFKSSELLLAQEFLYTEFDWRIGILNRQVIFACQYFMSRQHWQIVHYDSAGNFAEGAFRCLSIDEVPDAVLQIALKAAGLIGDGLYGVDVKQNQEGVYVIEVNDNPNIEAGVEDGVLKSELYLLIMKEFLTRLERNKRLGKADAPVTAGSGAI